MPIPLVTVNIEEKDKDKEKEKGKKTIVTAPEVAPIAEEKKEQQQPKDVATQLKMKKQDSAQIAKVILGDGL